MTSRSRELLQNELSAMKGALRQALCHSRSVKSDVCRVAEAAFQKATEAVAKADDSLSRLEAIS